MDNINTKFNSKSVV